MGNLSDRVTELERLLSESESREELLREKLAQQEKEIEAEARESAERFVNVLKRVVSEFLGDSLSSALLARVVGEIKRGEK